MSLSYANFMLAMFSHNRTALDYDMESWKWENKLFSLAPPLFFLNELKYVIKNPLQQRPVPFLLMQFKKANTTLKVPFSRMLKSYS